MSDAVVTDMADTRFASNMPLGLRPSSPHAKNIKFIKQLQMLESEQLRQVVTRLVVDGTYSTRVANIARKEFLRYAAMWHLSEMSLTPTNIADEFWHCFILHTRDYESFCLTHFGHFVHHEPVSEKMSNDELGHSHHLYNALFGSPDFDFFCSTLSRLEDELRSRLIGARLILRQCNLTSDGADQLGAGCKRPFKNWVNWKDAWDNSGCKDHL